MQIVGITGLLALSLYVYFQYRTNGIYFFIDISKIAFVIWLLVSCLYNLQLSRLYHPNWKINSLLLLVCFNFYLMAYLKLNSKNTFHYVSRSLLIFETPFKEKRYIGGITVLFFLGILSTALTFNRHGFVIFNENKVHRTELSLGYFFYGLNVCAIYFYILFKRKKYSKNKKEQIKALTKLIASLFMLTLLLNRGSMFIVMTGIILYELYVHLQQKKYFSNSFFIRLLVAVFIIVWTFGYLGDIRHKYVMDHVYHSTVVQRYGLPSGMPSGLGQLYVYTTSPIENMAHVIENQQVKSYTWFNKLFYPFIKLCANLLSQGDEYKTFLNSQTSIYPYLNSLVGLNVMSFMADAYQDLDIPGIVIYLFFYDSIILLSHKLLKSKLLSISKIIIYTHFLQIILWSPFTNSVFAISTMWTNILFVYIIDQYTQNCPIFKF